LVWNDFLSGSIGTVLIDIIAWSTSTLAYVINRVASENYISTMTLRESAVRLGSLVGYKLRGSTPSTVAVEASIPAPVSKDVTIFKGTLVKVPGPTEIVYEVDADYTIKAGNTTPITAVVSFSPSTSGTSVIQSYVSVVNGSVYADVVDTSVDLTQYVQVGQTFQRYSDTGSTLSTTESTKYVITGLTAATNAISNNRFILSSNWLGATGTVAINITDTRITIIQGQTLAEKFTTPSTLTPSYSVVLSRTDIIDNSYVVTINGTQWAQVTSVAAESSSSTSYEVRTQSSGSIAVLFGDGTFGQVVPTSATVTISYRVGGGSVGNVASGTIQTSIIGSIVTLNTPIAIAITNQYSAGAGGQEPETLEEARVNIPTYTRTNDRAVTLDDYETLATGYYDSSLGRVKYARAAVRTQNSLLEGNVVVIYAWAEGTSGSLVPLNSALKQSLQRHMQTKAVGTDYVVLADGTAKEAPISIRFKTFDGFSVTDTAARINSIIASTISGLKPGASVSYSNLVSSLDSVFGVDTVTIATPRTDLVPDSDSEILTVPTSSNLYTANLTSVGGLNYTAQIPVYPLQAWSFNAYLGSRQLLVLQDSDPNYARLFDSTLVDYRTGLIADIPSAALNTALYYLATDTSILYRSNGTSWIGQPDGTASASRINLLTGEVRLSLYGTPGTVSVSLTNVQGYNRERAINVYIGYTGTDMTQSKRSEIRDAVKRWFVGQSVGASVFAQEVSGLEISRANLTEVVKSISGVQEVTRIALDTPGNQSVRLDSSDNELLTVNNVFINNLAN